MQDLIRVLASDTAQAALIARALRNRGVFALPGGVSASGDALKGVIAADAESLSLAPESLPLLALGEACVALARSLGASAGEETDPEGLTSLRLNDPLLFADMPGGEYMLHGVYPLTLPEGLTPIAEAGGAVIGFRSESLPLYGMQYPIERNDPYAAGMLARFACDLCGCADDWNEERFIDRAVKEIAAAVPEGLAICAVSGGVDSAVSAALAYRALGGRLRCLYVDTGLGRSGEAENAVRTFSEATGIPTACLDRRRQFLEALEGISSPEEKERTAERMLRTVLAREKEEEEGIRAFITGTNLSDLTASPAESGREPAGGEIAPIRLLFKEEVRRVAAALGLPESIRLRQPFPTSGLALRILGAVTEERLNLLRAADTIFSEEIRSAGLDRRLWQYYAALLEIPGMEGACAVCLRALPSADTGSIAARLPFDVLENASFRIMESLPAIRRVVYDLSPNAQITENE